MSEKLGHKPDFIGIGTAKAATSWIFLCLKEHPEICFSSRKETYFFNRVYNYRKDIKYYHSFFSHCPKNKIKGEFTPNYINYPHVPYLIHKHFPEVKIIACLRNPIDKIYTEYRYIVNLKRSLSIYKTFEEAITKNPKLIGNGYYYEHLKRYFELFPRKNILILIYEEIMKNPITFLKEIYSFLGLKNMDFIPSTLNQRINVTGYRKGKSRIPLVNSFLYIIMDRFRKDSWLKMSLKNVLNASLEKFLEFNVKGNPINMTSAEEEPYPSMNEVTRKYLYQIYKKDIEKTEKLINRNLNFWKYTLIKTII